MIKVPTIAAVTATLENVIPNLNEYRVVEIDKSEETDSGVFGVHIVF